MSLLSLLQGVVAPILGGAQQNNQLDAQGNVVVNVPKPTISGLGLAPNPQVAQNTSLVDSAISANTQQPQQIPKITPAAPQDAGVPTVNYNNSADAQAATQATRGYALDTNDPQRGLYGLLPQNMQHGVLRNILGTIGDAFLVQSGHQAQYGPRLQREQMGQAMAGLNIDDPDSVRAAVSRLAASGVPGAAEMADKVQQQATEAALKRQMQEQTTWFHKARIDDMNMGRWNQQAPVVLGGATRITDPDQYAQYYGMWDKRVKALDPSASAATAYGIPSPDEWQPGYFTSGYGLSTNQQQVASDKAAGRQVTERGQDIGYQGRVQAAGINAGGHITAAQIGANRPSDAQYRQYLTDKQNSGQPLTSAEQQDWDKLNSVPRTARPPSTGTSTNTQVPLRQVGPGNLVANEGKPVSPAQFSQLPSGKNIHFYGVDGKWHIKP